MFEQLIDLLQNQSALYAELLEAAYQKKSFVINNDIDAIRRVTARENNLIGKLQRIEKQRQALASDIAGRLNIPLDGLTLAALTERINDESARERLTSLRIRLRGYLNELKTLNEQNRALINQNLEYIDFTMNLLRSSVSGPVYAGAEEIHGQVFFDARG